MTIFGANETAEKDKGGLGWVRLAIGIAQGLALYLLYLSAEAKAWPSTVDPLFVPLILVMLFVPTAALGGVGRFRPRTLILWLAAAVAITAIIGWWAGLNELADGAAMSTWFGALIFPAGAAVLFILHHLILPADLTRRRIAPYPVYFDTAWKAGVQLALSGAFTGAFWLLLLLGGGLFSMIGLNFLRDLIGQEWFAIPATTLIFAAAVHLTDVRDGLIRGVRTVALMLLSWLLPVMALITAAFVLVLPFTGVGRLWDEGYGTGLMLAAAAALIILINAAYQDGEPDGRPHVALQWTARLAGVLLVPLMGLALWGMGLRIGQHGLTPERIIALTLVLLGAVYGAGYAFAAVRPGPWMRPLERTNIVAALAAVIAILALFTPIADPARLSVADQMRRLETGRVSAEDFDYAFLRFDAGRAGRRALDRLAASDDAETARRAGEARAAEYRHAVEPAQADLFIEPVAGSPALPEGFLDAAASGDQRWTCRAPGGCVAAARDLDGDGEPEWLVADARRLAVYQWTDDAWREVGGYQLFARSPQGDAREILRSGAGFAPARWPDLEAEGVAVPLTPRPDVGGPRRR